MSVVKRYAPEERVPKLLRRRGGLTAEQAVAAAESNLEVIRGKSLQGMDEAIARIEALNQSSPGLAQAAANQQAYEAANQVVAMAGVFGLDDLGVAAYSLCELLLRIRGRSVGDPRAVSVHLDGFRLLRHPTGDAAAVALRREIIAGLQKVVGRAEG